MQTLTVSVDSLSVDTFNPRRTHDDEAVKALAGNIKQHGVLAPLIVRSVVPAGAEPVEGVVSFRYSVLCGSRRLAAAKLADMAEVPCIVRQLTDAEAAEVALTEQGSHEDLHYLELAEAYERWERAGVSRSEIGEKMARFVKGEKKAQSKQTVSAIIALNRLTPEVKRACWDGKIEQETARAIAPMPPQTHAAILKKCLEPSPAGGPKSTRECREEIAKFRLDLEKAPFDATDKTLGCINHNTDCGSCPQRSGSQPELFTEVKNDWLCTFPEGFAKKAQNAWERLVDDGEHNRGPKCLQPKQTDKYFDLAGGLRDDVPYVAANDVCHEDTAQRPYSALIGKSPRQHFVLARNPKTLAVVELIGKEKLPKLLDEAGKIRRRPIASARTAAAEDDEPKLSAEEKKRHQEKVARRQKAIRRAIAAIVAKVEKREFGKREWRMLAETLFAQGALRLTLERRDVQEPPARYLDRMNEGQLRAFVFEGSLEYELFGEDGAAQYSARLKEAAELFGVDLRDIENQVVAAERAEPEVRKVVPTKPEPKAKKGAAK